MRAMETRQKNDEQLGVGVVRLMQAG